MKRFSYILLLLLVSCFFACEEELTRSPIDNDNVPPPPLVKEDIVVIPKAGGAFIKYVVPEVEDVAGVELRYTLASGKEFIMKASALSDSLVVDGFIGGKAVTVFLLVYDKALNYSTPIEVEIVPNKSALEEVFETFSAKPTFGGFHMTWTNSERQDVVVILTNIVNGDTVALGGLGSNYYSTAAKGEYIIRGLESHPHECFVQVRDKWLNYSEKRSFEGKPLYEKDFRTEIQTMNDQYSDGLGIENDAAGFELWFNDIPNLTSFYPAGGSAKLPWYTSFDMGEKVIVSRVVSWQYAYDDKFWYHNQSPRIFEWYGSNDPSYNMDNWTLIETCVLKRPSGTPSGTPSTEEDIAYAKAGISSPMPIGTASYRYYRIRPLENWEASATAFGAFIKFTIWGQEDE